MFRVSRRPIARNGAESRCPRISPEAYDPGRPSRFLRDQLWWGFMAEVTSNDTPCRLGSDRSRPCNIRLLYHHQQVNVNTAFSWCHYVEVLLCHFVLNRVDRVLLCLPTCRWCISNKADLVQMWNPHTIRSMKLNLIKLSFLPINSNETGMIIVSDSDLSPTSGPYS